MMHEPRIEILATEVRVARGGFDFKDAVVDGQERHVERTAAEVKDEHRLFLRLDVVQAVGDGRCGRLVDDAHHLQPGDDPGVLGRLALGVVKVRRNRNHGLGDGRAQVRLGNLLHLQQDHRRDLLGTEGLLLALVRDLDERLAPVLRDNFERPVLHIALHARVRELAADQTLGVKDGVFGVHGRLIFGCISNETLGVGERDVGRRCAVALVVGDDLHAPILPDSDARVGRPQINTNCNSIIF